MSCCFDSFSDNGIAFDEKHHILYVNISQVFSIVWVPFHSAPVTLVTALALVKGRNLNSTVAKDDPSEPERYYIQAQNDLYQVDQFVRFFLPWGGAMLVFLWHWFATLCCIVGAKLGSPITWNMQVLADANPQYPDVPHHHVGNGHIIEENHKAQ